MNALRIPRPERDRLVERLQGVHMPPIGIQHGNADLADSCVWTPTDVQPGTTPLPTYPTPADKDPIA